MHSFVKSAVKAILPERLRRSFKFHIANRWEAEFRHKPDAEVFTTIYREGRWGDTPDGAFCSGTGSHDPEVVQPYVNAVGEFLQSFPTPPDVVDLGCGDFNVGNQRPFARRYVACDVVPDLIEQNQKRFADASVEFRCVDIIADELPVGEVAIIRQVLQH